jgi:imidazolonepropionase-like amidohydrolase
MANLLVTNARIIDGGGGPPFAGEVLVQGNRILRVGRGARSLPAAGVETIDAGGATLMPGMVEAHTHFSWNNTASLDAIQRMPLEEHVLWAAHVAKTYLDAGWTSCLGAACAKPRLDVVIRNAIADGLIPGPRYLAASQEITVAGGLGDEMPAHLPFPELSFGVVVSGVEEMRKCVRTFLKYGVDMIKLNLSGDNFVPHAPADTTWMTDEEVAVACAEAKLRGKRVTAHARSAASVKQAVRHGVEIIYHASFTDEEALDLLEANKSKVFIAPGIAILIALLEHAEPWGFTRKNAIDLGYEIELNAAIESLKKMHKRGIRILPGGDYGFAFTPHGENARDLEHFVKLLGFSPMEAIVSATRLGGEIMMMGDELGQIRDGFLADLLLVDGDPLSDIGLLRRPDKLLMVMRDGVIVKRPDVGADRSRWSRVA